VRKEDNEARSGTKCGEVCGDCDLICGGAAKRVVVVAGKSGGEKKSGEGAFLLL